ncbi:MAG TPA: circularly permuted type 2 ATP-grasp protein [Chthoniobacterales bacterium]
MGAPTVPPLLPPLGYQRRKGTHAVLYDEFLSPDGSVRPHWQEIGAYFEKLGPEEITRRWNHARKIIRDNGVASNAGLWDAQGPPRPWELNPIPLRISNDEWTVIEAAVRQRGRLLNAILNDLYAEQKLLAEGLIPPALVLGNRAYLRPCVGVRVPHDARLSIYAVDLARSPDGKWWVLSDRTQAPSGAGYALENRVVISRVFPEIFHNTQIARLGGFFRQMKEALEALSPRAGLPPTVALLTPGRLNETYFEQTYLARQLDFTLVEGQDLTVRDNTVFIRTLQGLQRVDVIVRRVDDDYCDPLEMRDESLLGVPGLMSAVRAGAVTLANSLGSGLVQCPALGAFLPKLSERLLGEALLMPSVATWWCGQHSAHTYVLNNLHGLVVHPAFAFPGEYPAKNASREAIHNAICNKPELFAAQEFVRLSQSPDFNEGRLEPRSVVMRIFAMRRGDDYVVMPGGLTRVSEQEFSDDVLFLSAGGTKDTWVDFAEKRDAVAQPQPVFSGQLRRASPSLTSRTADDLFWLGRYAERAEFSARMVRTTLEGLANQQGWMTIFDFEPVIRTFQHFGQFFPPLLAEDDHSLLEQAIITQMLDRSNPGSLVSIIGHLEDIITSVRDQVTADTWRIVHQLSDVLPAAGEVDEGIELNLNTVILHLSALNGVLTENMTHGNGWRFLELGRRIERSSYSARLVVESLVSQSGNASPRFDVLLEVFDALITYRQKYTVVHREPVLDLLICDESNPRSLASQLALLLDDLLRLPREAGEGFKLAEERLVLRVLSDVRLLDVANLDATAIPPVENAMLELSEHITRRFFTHLQTSSVGRDVIMPTLPDTI